MVRAGGRSARLARGYAFRGRCCKNVALRAVCKRRLHFWTRGWVKSLGLTRSGPAWDLPLHRKLNFDPEGLDPLKIIDGGDGAPQEPDWPGIYDDPLDAAVAQSAWGQVLRELRERETLAHVNGLQIKRYVMALVLHEVASRHVIEDGPVTLTDKGQPQYNPWWAVMKDADARATAHESELGLSPRRRAGASKVSRAKKKITAADAYLKTVSK